jgi:hypothetical protein
MTLTEHDDGSTELTGPLIDQAALYGLLGRLRDLGATRARLCWRSSG